MSGSASDIRAGGAYVELGTISDKLDKGLKEAAKKVEEFAGKVESVGKKVMALGTAMTAPVLGAVASFTQYGSMLKDMSDRTGMSSQSLAFLGYAAEQTGASIESVTTAARFAQRAIFEASAGNKKAAESFQRLGLDVAALQKMSPDQQFQAIAKAIGQVKNPTEQVAIAMQMFGRGAQALLPMLRMNNDEWETMRRRQEALRPVTQDGVNLADELGDLWVDLKYGMAGIGDVIASTVGPALRDFQNKVAGILVLARQWLNSHREVIWTYLKVAAAVFASGAAIFAFGKMIALVAYAMTGLRAITAVVFPAIAAGIKLAFSASGPAVLAIMAIGIATMSLLDYFGIAKTGISGFFNSIRIGGASIGAWMQMLWLEVFRGWTILENGLAQGWDWLVDAAASAADGVSRAFYAALNGIRQMLKSMLETAAEARYALGGDTSKREADQKWIDQNLGEAAAFGPTEEERFKANAQRQQAYNERKGQRASEVEAITANLDETKARIEKTDSNQPGAIDGLIASLKGTVSEDILSEIQKAWEAVPDLSAPGGAVSTVATGGGAASLREAVSTAGTARGTFNGSALFGMGASSNLAERTATAGEETAANTKSIAEKIGKLGLEFA